MLVYRNTIDSVLLFLLQNLFFCSWESNLKKIKNKYRTRIFFKYLSCVFTIMIRPSCHHKNHNDLKPLSWFIRASERKWVVSVLSITFASRCAVINLIIPPPLQYFKKDYEGMQRQRQKKKARRRVYSQWRRATK